MVILLNPNILESSFIPERLRARDSEISKIMEVVIKPALNNITTNLIIYGDSGTGKTVTMRFLAREVRNPKIFYINAISYRSVKNVLVELLSHEGVIISERASYANIYTRLEKAIEKYDKTVILVIDEAANILRTDEEGLYYLFRSKDSFDVNISAIFIAMDDPALLLNQRIKRSYGLFNELKFKRYSKDEILEIVRDRARMSLNTTSYDDTIIDYIAEISSEFGSARVAIDILAKAAHIAEYRRSENISYDDVRAAKSMISPYVTESKLASLDKYELAALLAICGCLSHSVSTDIACVSEQLKILREQYSLDPEMDIYEILRKLEGLGIINSYVESSGKSSGVRKKISIHDVPVSVLAEKIGNLLNGMA
ncbi:origin recognition complex protein 1 [Thermoplasma volcanium GSS1]|uniref:Origin recognition complex protein 1 n=1 Tax=Thermoplasma volcanium (strain ATCC 51530 / DSM 4299 / JCM 9571 / NBRC 15438 / GSS1) TaxID=273116 RepID=Q979T7_THEVO|nr:Cdc6/Cdc18 family protein [Thermoplasma volcanium]BAB60215.1 origin recognition complex protein 1 [Thermoplasma volcanium GSS1]